MGPKIFVSYRRKTDSHFAGRLFDALCLHYGHESIFMDVDNIDAGLDFVAAMHEAVVAADVLLVVIGRGWARIKDGTGKYRLHDPEDPVAFELATALTLGKSIVPILVEQASMPAPSALPEVLRPLVRLNGLHIRHSSFRSDLRALLAAIDKLTSRPVEPPVQAFVTPHDEEVEDEDPMEELQRKIDEERRVSEHRLGAEQSDDDYRVQFRQLLRAALESRGARTREARYEVYDEGRRALAGYIAGQGDRVSRQEADERVLLFEDCVLEQEARFEDVRVSPGEEDTSSSLDEMFAAELQAALRRAP